MFSNRWVCIVPCSLSAFGWSCWPAYGTELPQGYRPHLGYICSWAKQITLDSDLSRKFWKDDDGIADLILKAGSVLAIVVAAHQYYYKVYPVWSKQKELAEATAKLDEVAHQTSVLEKKASALTEEKAKLETEIETLSQRQRELIAGHEKQIEDLKKAANEEREQLLNEKAQLEKGLSKAETQFHTLIVEAIAAHLQRFAYEIFQIQLNSILSQKEDTLDLQRDALSYVKEHRLDAKSDVEKAAFEILEAYARSEIASGVKSYTEILGVYIMFQYEPYGTEAIKSITQKLGMLWSNKALVQTQTTLRFVCAAQLQRQPY